MPELPEVETVARGLQRSVAGRRIVSVTLRKTDFMDDPAAIERELPGAKIEKIERFGKFMLLRLTSEKHRTAQDTTETQGEKGRKSHSVEGTASELGSHGSRNDMLAKSSENGAADSIAGPAHERALLVHLGMTGNLAAHFAEQPMAKHTHVTFALDDGRELRYI